jgi:hypothetical protein
VKPVGLTGSLDKKGFAVDGLLERRQPRPSRITCLCSRVLPIPRCVVLVEQMIVAQSIHRQIVYGVVDRFV